ncbi:hypothetical protein [Maioricimonas sp. JC845]|uniref:hypothetical protein n=1 Tax=Maioricimonas sp. JC845 TaxID=3232138 RepID=UPI00345AD124
MGREYKDFSFACRYFQFAESLVNVYVPQMIARDEWALAKRSCCDAMEYVAKGIGRLEKGWLRTIRGPHDYQITEDALSRLEMLYIWADTPSKQKRVGFLVTCRDGRVAVLRHLGPPLTMIESFYVNEPAHPVGANVHESGEIDVLLEDGRCWTFYDPMIGQSLKGTWRKISLDGATRKHINTCLAELEKSRIDIFKEYCDREEAENYYAIARSVVTPVLNGFAGERSDTEPSERG